MYEAQPMLPLLVTTMSPVPKTPLVMAMIVPPPWMFQPPEKGALVPNSSTLQPPLMLTVNWPVWAAS